MVSLTGQIVFQQMMIEIKIPMPAAVQLKITSQAYRLAPQKDSSEMMKTN